VLALVDIDLIKKSAQQVTEARAFTEALINTMRRPVLVLDKELIIQTANQIFYQTFQVKPERRSTSAFIRWATVSGTSEAAHLAGRNPAGEFHLRQL